MIVTILRHGQAGSAPIDSQRTLTSKGREDITLGAQKFCDSLLNRNLPEPSLILYSQWLRTTQTAQIVSSQFPRASVEPTDSLVPGATQSDVNATLSSVLEQAIAVEHVTLVSHQPLVSELADYYLGYPNSVPGLSPGALFTLEMGVSAQDCASLLFWAAPPSYEVGR